jgi:Zn-dependent M28 family amino/carboxypeptidase
LDEAGAAGVLTSTWTGGWGATRLFGTSNERAPALGLSCEDYGLVYRLAENGQNPVLRVETEVRFLGDVPVSNTVGEISGTERPDEYVLLSAHLDTWDGASGATDNGTGTIIMMEAMRILKEVYPNPKRTIIAAHWNGEEQGLNGSRAFSEDHPEIVQNLQVLLNQDNGTGRVGSISMSGFTEAGRFFSKWMNQIPQEITEHIEMEDPGAPSTGGSDHASFQCHGAPAIRLGSDYWDYREYTWHTTRDTFDKISFDDVRSNAVLTAMLAYLAAEEPEQIPRDRISDEQASAEGGQQASWPDCRPATRSAEGR